MGIGRQLRRAHRPRAKHVVARPLHALLQANHVHRQPRLRPPSIWTMMTTRYVSSVPAPNFGTGARPPAVGF